MFNLSSIVPYHKYSAVVAEIKAKIEIFKAERKEQKKKFVSLQVTYIFGTFYCFSKILSLGCLAG